MSSGQRPSSEPCNLIVEIRLEFGAHVEQLVTHKSKNDHWRGVQFAERQILKAINTDGIVGPDFDSTIQIPVRRAEEISSRDGAQQTRWLLQGINGVVHTALG